MRTTHLLWVAGLIGFVVVGCASSTLSYGQQPQENVADLSIDESIATLGVEAAKRGDYEESVQLLTPVFENDAGYKTQQGGAVGYWLGHARDEVSGPQPALRTWNQTMRALDEMSPAWMRTADALVRTTFATGTHPYYEVAAQTFMTFIEQAGNTASFPPAERRRIQQHLLETTFVLPDNIKRRVGLDPADEIRRITDLTFNEHAGEVLTAWWRQQDRQAATPSNERLMEHLVRVEDARRAYMHDEYIDARGRVYIRLGPPPITLDVTFDDSAELWREVIRPSPSLTSFDFSPGIYWEYDELGHEAHFLFFEEEQGDVYELGGVMDMMPRRVRNHHATQGSRSSNTYAFLRGMEVALAQLSVYNPMYMERYSEVENYIAYLKTGGGLNFETPTEQAVKVNHQSQREDHRLKRIRRETVGAAQSTLDNDQRPLDVQMRWARFLDQDGATRTEVYWSVPTDDLNPRDAIGESPLEVDESALPDESRVVATARLEDEQHRAAHQATTQTDVEAPADLEQNRGQEAAWILPQTVAIRSEMPSFHLGLQWDQRLGASADAAGNFLLRQSTARLDSLQQLDATSTSLEMSDVKLVTVDPESLRTPLDGEALTPYPQQTATLDTPFGVYFEVYHLAFDDSDRTRYTIDLEVNREQPRRGISRWVRGDDVTQTATTTTSESAQRRVQELFLLDMESWDDVGDQEEVTLTVRVTDDITGDFVEREVKLTLLNGAS